MDARRTASTNGSLIPRAALHAVGLAFFKQFTKVFFRKSGRNLRRRPVSTRSWLREWDFCQSRSMESKIPQAERLQPGGNLRRPTGIKLDDDTYLSSPAACQRRFQTCQRRQPIEQDPGRIQKLRQESRPYSMLWRGARPSPLPFRSTGMLRRWSHSPYWNLLIYHFSWTVNTFLLKYAKAQIYYWTVDWTAPSANK